MDYFIRTEAKGNPIQLILLLIRLFYPSKKRKKDKKGERKRNNFPTKREQGERKTTRRQEQVEKPLNLDFDNRTKIEPVIKRFISSRPYRTISNTNNRYTFDPFRRPWLVPSARTWKERRGKKVT